MSLSTGRLDQPKKLILSPASQHAEAPRADPIAPDLRWVSAGWIVTAWVGFAIGIVYLFWPAFASGFAQLPGTLGDFRFINVMLEHWYHVLLGKSAWRDPAFFFPQAGVLGYSDALFLHAVPYSLLRLSRISPHYALFGTLVALMAIGYASTLWLLRRILGVAWPVAIFAAMVFMFSNMMVLKIIHPHFYAVAFVPLVVGLLWRVVADIHAGRPFGRDGVLLCVLVPMLLFSSYYIGWLTIFLIVAWGVVLLAMQAACARPALDAFVARAWHVRYSLLGLCTVFVVALVPFVATYLQPYRDFGPRPWEEVFELLPSIGDFVNVGWGNPLWTRWSAMLVPAGRPMGHELTVGMAPGIMLVFTIVLAIEIRKQSATCGGREVAGRVRRTALLCLALAVVLCWLLMLKVGGMSLWATVFKLVPGASAIRGVFRFQLLLHLAVLVFVAVALDRLWRSRRWRAAVGVLLALLVAEEVNYFRIAFDARAETTWLERLQPPPETCRYFALAPGSARAARVGIETDLDAMAVAQRTGVPTINGYSSAYPRNWDLAMRDVQSPTYAASVLEWLRAHDLRDGLCLLDPSAGTWWSPKADASDLRHVNLVRREASSFESGLELELKGFHSLEPIGRWTNGTAEVVPALPIPAMRVVIDGQVLNPAGSRLRIALNGVTVLDRKLSAGAFRFEFPRNGMVARIEIASTTFVPRLAGVNDDSRQLGVLISDVTVE